MDKAGLIEGLGSNSYVIGSAERRSVTSKKLNSHTWISFIKCISTLRVSLNLVVIYKGAFVQQQWFLKAKGPYKGWHFSTT